MEYITYEMDILLIIAPKSVRNFRRTTKSLTAIFILQTAIKVPINLCIIPFDWTIYFQDRSKWILEYRVTLKNIFYSIVQSNVQ